jgi:hypothetical protein
MVSSLGDVVMSPRQLTLTQGQPLSMGAMTTRTSAIEVTGLRKSYGDHEVVAGVDLTVPAVHGQRPARAQRGRQDHHSPDPVHVAPCGRR